MKYNKSFVISENDSISKIVKKIKKNSIVLEFGSANGRMTKYLKEFMNCKVYIVEIEKEAFDDAIKYAEDGLCDNIMNYKWMETFSRIQFDVIVFADVLEHLPFPAEVLKNAVKLLSQNGTMLISIPNIAHNDIIINLFKNKFCYTDVGILDDTHIHFWAYEELEQFINSCDLEIVSEDAVICNTTESEQFDKCNVTDNTLLEILAKRPLGLVYQFILELKAKDNSVAKYKTKKGNRLENIEKRMVSKLYYDDGNGFSEDKTIISQMWSSNKFEYVFVFPYPVKACRFDPVEKAACVLKNVVAISNYGVVKFENKNGITLDKYEVFVDTMPQLYFNFEHQPIYSIRITADIHPIYDTESIFFLSKLFGLKEQIAKKKTIIKEQVILKKSLIEEKSKLEIQFEEQLVAERNRTKQFQEQLEAGTDRTKQLQEQLEAEVNRRKQLQEQLEAEADRTKQLQEQLEAKVNRTKQLQEQLETEKSNTEKLEVQYEKCRHEWQQLSDKIVLLEFDLCSRETEITKYITLENDFHELQNMAYIYQSMYNEITKSASWKMTKPIRLVLDGVKKTLNSNKVLNYANKGIKSLYQNGLTYTYEKTKLVFKKRGTNLSYLSELKKDKEDLEMIREEAIKFSILIPVFNTPEKLLEEAIESVIGQNYSNWELCIVDGSDTRESEIEKICRHFEDFDSRIRYKKLFGNLGISRNTNECAKMASGEYIVLFDHDDLLMKNALRENAIAIYKTNADILYSDEDHVTLKGHHVNPFFKPDWSPDLLYSQMYVCHLFVFRKTLFDEVGGFDSDYDGSQDYDLLLRMSEKTNAIFHIPQILYSWRETNSSTASNPNAKPYAHMAGLKALTRHLKTKYGEYAYAVDTEYSFVYEARFHFLEKKTKSFYYNANEGSMETK